MPFLNESSETKIIQVRHHSHDIFSSDNSRSLLSQISKALSPPEKEELTSNIRNGAVWKIPHPYHFKNILAFKEKNPHHSACIDAKTQSTVGLGFYVEETEEQKIERQKQGKPKPPSKVCRTLDPICSGSFFDVMSSAGQDYMETGNGYIEVRINPNTREVLSLHYLPSCNTYIYLEDDRGKNYHYMHETDFGTSLRFARFGDIKSFLSRWATNQNAPFKIPTDPVSFDLGKGGQIVPNSEIIHFRRMTNKHRFYGCPNWVAAVPSIELMTAHMQHLFDFFLNRGVPEFFLFLLGPNLDPDVWAKIEAAMKAQIGAGNSHKSIAMNLPYHPDALKIQIEKLAMGDSDDLTQNEMAEGRAMAIVSAHQVPPLLAGVVIPGKIAAVNELPNAIKAFQALTIEPMQVSISAILAKTLGNEDPKEGVLGLGLTGDDFRFVRLTDPDVFDLVVQDTMSRMRQTLPEAQKEGRDLSEGVKD